ncbi:MAG: YihY/virulence factor BrkB family protein [Deltaproteobacteria bacterium]|nr:YihY/virulence factor BrkB family protein [Deltaproteobacteria bacterium]
MFRPFGILLDSIKIFNRANSFTSAAAISFYAFFSLIPLMILVTASLGFIMGAKAGLLDRVIGMVKESVPYISDRIIGDVKGLSTEWKKMGWLGAISLIWSAEFVLEATAGALTSIFGTVERFGFVRRKLVNLFMLLLGILAALASIFMTAAALIIKNLRLKILRIDILDYFVQTFLFEFLFPFLVVAVVIAIIFKVFSGSGLDFKYAFAGSLIFATLWEAAKHVFAWYVSNFPSYNKVYGSLGALMLLLLWMFYSANILLFSASVAKAAYGRSGRVRTKKNDRLQGRKS